jgi:rhomboid family GlyGly-CTERM serine protease
MTDMNANRPRLNLAMRRLHPWRLPLAIACVAVLAQAFGLESVLRFQRERILHGQWWRLLTGNFVHLGWMHLARDLAGLGLIWTLFRRSMSERSWLALTLLGSLGVGLGLLALDPAIDWYVGLSGMLFALFAAGAALEWGTSRMRSLAMLGGMTALLLYTVGIGPLPGGEIGLGGRVIAQAHVYGACTGLAYILCRGGWLRWRSTRGHR